MILLLLYICTRCSCSPFVSAKHARFQVALTRMFGLEATVVLADRPAESLLLLSQTLGLNLATSASVCSLGHRGDGSQSARRRLDLDQAAVRAVHRIHAFDYRLYNAARRLFRRQWHHAFGRVVDLRLEHPLDCGQAKPACFESTNASLPSSESSSYSAASSSFSAPRLPERLAKRVADGVEVVCTQRCTIQGGLG